MVATVRIVAEITDRSIVFVRWRQSVSHGYENVSKQLGVAVVNGMDTLAASVALDVVRHFVSDGVLVNAWLRISTTSVENSQKRLLLFEYDVGEAASANDDELETGVVCGNNKLETTAVAVRVDAMSVHSLTDRLTN